MKERLTGAIILVALLVLLVPELLTGPSPKAGANPAGAESAPMRSYTIDLDDEANARPGATTPPNTAPSLATNEPVGQATPESDGQDDGAAAPMGSGADDSAADAPATDAPATDAAATGAAAANSDVAKPAAARSAPDTAVAESGKPSTGTAGNDEPEQPRSAFGPNAMNRAQPEPSRSASGSTNSSASSAKPKGSGEAARASSGPAASSAPASGSSAPRASRTEEAPASRVAASKGWAVQLGVFASRENAERLAKQVKGKGYPVVVNETSGSKRLYRVRVGPEADRAAAVALGAKLRAAGHAGAVVPFP